MPSAVLTPAAGMPVIATIGSGQCGAGLTRAEAGAIVYALDVASAAAVPGCGIPGAAIVFYVGGQPVTNGIRVVIDHIARSSSSAEERQQTARWIKRIMQPHIERYEGVYWEFHADETSSELWMIDGLVPPPGGSEAEKLWARQNAATPYEISS